MELPDGATTTAWGARFERSRFDLRVALINPCATVLRWCQENRAEHAIVGGFYMRPGGPPLGHLRIDGTTVASEPFDAPWDERRACVHSVDGGVALAAWQDLPTDAGGDLVQAGPMLAAAGRNLIESGEDREGFAAGARQFDSDITDGRYPRAALGISDRELIAVACDGREDDEAGLSMAELASAMIDFGALDAINLDGGGSASLVVDRKLVNTPREEHGIPLRGGRAVSTALRFVPR
ncbi:MAG TPA: phosphodiester glycosidase family protein [Solirubrobacterales bacterium]|nr:phosphodiester glycosidase family protein [Solirubrobacterales bacterium]